MSSPSASAPGTLTTTGDHKVASNPESGINAQLTGAISLFPYGNLPNGDTMQSTTYTFLSTFGSFTKYIMLLDRVAPELGPLLSDKKDGKELLTAIISQRQLMFERATAFGEALTRLRDLPNFVDFVQGLHESGLKASPHQLMEGLGGVEVFGKAMETLITGSETALEQTHAMLALCTEMQAKFYLNQTHLDKTKQLQGNLEKKRKDEQTARRAVVTAETEIKETEVLLVELEAKQKGRADYKEFLERERDTALENAKEARKRKEKYTYSNYGLAKLFGVWTRDIELAAAEEKKFSVRATEMTAKLNAINDGPVSDVTSQLAQQNGKKVQLERDLQAAKVEHEKCIGEAKSAEEELRLQEDMNRSYMQDHGGANAAQIKQAQETFKDFFSYSTATNIGAKNQISSEIQTYVCRLGSNIKKMMEVKTLADQKTYLHLLARETGKNGGPIQMLAQADSCALAAGGSLYMGMTQQSIHCWEQLERKQPEGQGLFKNVTQTIAFIDHATQSPQSQAVQSAHGQPEPEPEPEPEQEPTPEDQQALDFFA